MAPNHTGGCLCKATRYRVEGGPEYALQCYCRDCQHISGGGNLPQIAVRRETLSLSGSVRTYHWKANSGNDLELGFCAECGSPIYKSTTLMPDMICLVAGSLDDPSAYSSDHKVFEQGRQPWDKS